MSTTRLPVAPLLTRGQAARIRLAGYAWDRLEEAAGELPPTPPAALFDRFLSWTRWP